MDIENSPPAKEFLREESPAEKSLRFGLSLLFGAILGASGGWLLFDSLFGQSRSLIGGVLGAVVLGGHELLQETRRRRGQPRPQWSQLAPDFFLGVIFGWLLAVVFPGQSLLVYGLVLGLVRGLLGFQIRKLIFSLIVGLIFGAVYSLFFETVSVELLGALIWLSVRVVWLVLIREEVPVTMVGDQVPRERARYVVPFEANSKQVGIEFMRDLARSQDGSFKRNTPGIGLVDSFDVLEGSTFNPELVDPLIIDFYEHTSNYSLSIVPEWDWRYKPLFWVFKRFLAQPIGQANLPFNTEEAQKGIVSYIDTIDFTCDDIVDLRGWIRAYKDSLEAIYVGIYTTVREGDTGYISVGFPLPDATFTATLLPSNLENGHFILKTRDTGKSYPGHYLTSIDKETGDLGVIELSAMDEEIHVYTENGKVGVNHRFYLSGLNFLTLYYAITEKHSVE